jgi:hypothetical protein
MPGGPIPYLIVALVGLGVVAGGIGLVRLSGANLRLGRRLAGARETRVGILLDLQDPPTRPVRIRGRVRCPDPLVTADGDRLVAFHRDVEVRLPSGSWRLVDRLRETRSFDLWDHDGSLRIDPSAAAEPLVTIPRVWEGQPSDLEDTFRPAVERLATEHGTPSRARAITRTISVTDRLLVLARAERDRAGRVELRPPPGGYVISTLALDDAMRLLGGRGRRRLLVGAATIALGIAIGSVGGALALGAWLLPG